MCSSHDGDESKLVNVGSNGYLELNPNAFWKYIGIKFWYFLHNLGDYYYFDVFKKKTNEMKDKDWKEIMENCTKLWIYELLRE